MPQTILQELREYLTCCMGKNNVLRINVSGTNESVGNADDGTASVAVLTGNSPYTYLWSNGATTSSITGLTPGVYTVTVTDNKNRVKTGSYTVVEGVLPPSVYLYELFEVISDYEGLQDRYIDGQFDYQIIEGDYGVPSAGNTDIIITYGNQDEFLSEIITVDTTTSNSFWADIKGWLQMNNFYDIELDGSQWLILDPTNRTYISLSI